MRLSIIMPAYNERYTLCECVHRVFDARLPEGVTRELIIVDDCSTDGTLDIALDLAKAHEYVTVLRQEVNQGKGMAIRRALEVVTGDIVLIQDADLEYSPDNYARLIKPIVNGDADVVYGSRFGFADSRRVLYFKHTLGNRFLTFLSNWFTDLNLTDMETCYKVFKASIIKSLPLRSKRFGFEPEVTAKIAKRNARIFEVPVSYFGRTYQEGKKITWKDGLLALWVIIKYWIIDDIYKDEDKQILFAMSKTHRFNKWLASHLRPHLGNIVLEIGSGIGTMALELLPADHYTCTDIDPIHIDRLQNTFMNRPNVDVIKLDIEDENDLTKIQGRYDTVLCINVLEHVEDHFQVLRNINRLLMNEGKVIVLVPNCPFLYNSFDKVLGHKRRYTRKEVKDLLKQAGFGIGYLKTINKISMIGWFINGSLLKRRHFGRVQLKCFDLFVWLWKRIDPFLPWPGQSIIAVAEKVENV